MIRSSRKGFTLVEIMIVVAIIGILVAIAVPGFLKARRTSRLNACQENQTKIDGAAQNYILDEKLGGLGDCLFVSETHDATDKTDDDSDQLEADLVGADLYLRGIPVCPAGGSYTFTDDDAGTGILLNIPFCGQVVFCDYDELGDGDGDHVYPCGD